ncbi:MAG: flagellar motor protein MotB [Acidobacteriota bacterium]
MSIRLEPDEEEQEEGAPAWTVQFADMMSLLLVFFILLLSFSEIDAVKYRALSDSFRQAFGKTDQVKDMFNDPQATAQLISEESGAHNDAILDELRSIIPQSYPGALPDRDNGKGYLVRIPGRLLFDTGKDELKPEMKPKSCDAPMWCSAWMGTPTTFRSTPRGSNRIGNSPLDGLWPSCIS